MAITIEEPEYERELPQYLKAYKGEKFIPDIPESKRERFMGFKQGKIPLYALSPWEQKQFQVGEFGKLQTFGDFQWDIHQREMERESVQWADRLSRHRDYVSELSDEDYDAYTQRQEKKRLLMIQGFEDKYGWSLEDTLDYARGVGRKLETTQDWAKWMTPAQRQAQEASNQEKVTAAEKILWQIATPNALQLSEDKFVDFTYYKQQWLWSKSQNVPWEFNVQEALDALLVPYVEPSIEDLEVGTELDHWDAILYGIDIPEGSILRIEPSEEVVLTLIDEEGNETHPEWEDIKPWNIGESQVLDYIKARELGFSQDELGGYEESQFEIKLGEEAYELIARLDTDGWEYHEDMAIKPDGAILTYDELEEEIERARDEHIRWSQEFEDRMRLDVSIRYVFPDIVEAGAEDAPNTILQLLEDNPEQFWGRIQEVGRTVDTERLLKIFFGAGTKDGITGEQVAEIFGEPPPITWENALTAIPQNAWNFFSKTMPEQWFGKEDVAEKVFPAAKIIAEKFGPITDIWGEWLPDPSDYMEAASVIAELSDKYIFFPWRLAIAKTFVGAEQDPEAHDIEFMNEVTRLQQEFGQYGYAIHPEAIEAYDRWIEASGGSGTAMYWISELTNPVLWLPYGKVIKGAKWVFTGFRPASVPIKAVTPAARAEFLASQLERLLPKLEQATGPRAVVLRTRAASLELRLADVSVTMANEIRTSTAGAFLRELKLKYPDFTPQFERVFEPIFGPPMVGDGTMTLVGNLKSIAPVIPTSIDDTVRFLMKNHPGRLGQSAYGRWIKHANELDSLLKAGNIHRKNIIELGGAMADHFTSTIDLLLPPLGAKRLFQRGGIDSVWVIKDGQIVGGSGRIIGSKSGAPMIEGKVSHAWGDVIQNHKFYNFADERVHDWCEAAFKVIDELSAMATKQGLKFNRLFFGPLEHYFPRGAVRGLEGVVEEQIARIGVTPLSTTTSAMRERIFQFMQEGLELGYKYGTPREAFESYIQGVYRAIGNKQYISYLEQSQLGFFRLPAGQTQKIVNLLNRAVQGKSVKVPKWLVEAKPELAERIGAILRMTGAERTAALKELETTLRAQVPDWLTSATAKAEIATSQATKVARLEPIIKAIQRGEVPHPNTMRWIEKNYPEIMPRINELISSTRSVLERSIASRFRQQNLALTVEKLAAELDAVQLRLGQVTGSAKKALQITESSLNADLDIARTLAGKGTIESKIAHLRDKLNILQDTLGRRTTPFGRDMPGAAHKGVPGYILDAQERVYSKFIKAVELGPSKAVMTDVERTTMFNRLLNEVTELTRLARENAKGFAVERASAMDMASHVGFTESMTRIPGLQGRVFNAVTVNGRTYSGKEVVAMIEKSLAEKAPRWMEMISELNRGLVTLQAALDGSAPFIQGIPTLGVDVLNLLRGRPTAIWATSAAKHLYVMLNPRYLSAFRAKNAEIYSRYLKEGLITASDLSDFYRGIKLINNTMGKIPVLGKVPKTAYGRTQIGFGAWGEIARIEIIKSMERSWLAGGGTRAELAEFVNILTGVISTRGMGVGATQRALESMTLFAPRYFRANMMLIGAMGKGGMTGKMARQAIAGAAGGWLAAYCALSALAGQEPRLKPWPQNVEILGMKGDGATAFTIKFGDEYVGMPGFAYSVVKMFSGVIGVALTEPNKLLTFDQDTIMANHPEFRFLLYKTAPMMSLGYEMRTGRDVLGYKLETPGDYMEQIYENFLSIATQSIVTDDPPASPLGFGMELLGLRRLPELAWEKFDEYAAPVINKIQDNELDEVQLQKRANDELRFWDLDIFTRDKMLTDDPKLQELLDEAQKQTARRNSDEEVAIDAKRGEIDNWYASEETTRLEKLRDPDVDWNMVDFRRDLGDLAGDGYERRLHELEEAFPEYFADIEKRATEGLEDAPSFDVYYWKMYNWVFGPDTEDKYGDPIWSLIDQRLNELKGAYPEEYMDMFMFVKEFGYGDKDPLIFFIWEQKWKLRDFWESTADEFGERDKDKEDAYRKHPDNLDMEAALLFLGYRSTIMNPEAEDIVKQWCEEYNVALRDISLFSKWMIPEDMMEKYGITDSELGKQFDLLPTSGYDRKWFYQENPEFYQYRLGEGQITKEIDFNIIPTREGWPLIQAYEAAPTEPRNIRRAMRCRSEVLDRALLTTGRVSVIIYNTPECAELIAEEGEPPKPWEVKAGAVEFFEELKRD